MPVGVGVHTGLAFVGVVGGTQGNPKDFTALGDNVNIAARLAAEAGPGEILISEATSSAARIKIEGFETRELVLKGKSEPVSVVVIHASDRLEKRSHMNEIEKDLPVKGGEESE